MLRNALRGAYSVLLACVGFVLATIGLNVSAGEMPLSVITDQEGADRQESRIAAACIPDDSVAQHDEIFFLSCGGLF